MSDRLSSAGYKRLYALSGNECAFPGCTRPVTVEDHGTPVTTSEAAHIVAKSRQGPRGRVVIEDDERRSILNHLLFCDAHHKVVDANPRIYSVGVLRKMKTDHEANVARRPPAQPELPMTSEDVRITALPVIGLPARLYSATPLKSEFLEIVSGLRRRRRRDARDEVTPFVLEDRVWAFHDLSSREGPFARVVRRDSTMSHHATAAWSTEDGHRRYVRLLNQGFTLHLQSRGLEWDKKHNRFWFGASDGKERSVRVSTKTGQNRERLVAFEQRYKSSGESKGIWCHWALEWQFEHLAPVGWVLATRPAYQWTTDGSTLLDPDLIGKKAAQKMAHIYNAQYFDQVHLWQTWLTDGAPRVVVPMGHASLIVSSESPRASVDWPEIGDDAFVPTTGTEDDLLTLLDYQSALDLNPEELYVEEPDPETPKGDAA